MTVTRKVGNRTEFWSREGKLEGLVNREIDSPEALYPGAWAVSWITSDVGCYAVSNIPTESEALALYDTRRTWDFARHKLIGG